MEILGGHRSIEHDLATESNACGESDEDASVVDTEAVTSFNTDGEPAVGWPRCESDSSGAKRLSHCPAEEDAYVAQDAAQQESGN